MKSSLLHILSTKKSGADYWNFHMKRQYAICVSQKRLPKAHVALYWTVHFCAVQ